MIEWPDLNFVVCVYFSSLSGWARQSAGSICRSRIVLKLSSDPSCGQSDARGTRRSKLASISLGASLDLQDPRLEGGVGFEYVLNEAVVEARG